MSKSEIILWSKLSGKQMLGYKFRRQYGVDQYVLDFYCPRLKLAIEVDGESHFMPGAEEQDKARQEYIEAYGIRFLRFMNPDVCENIDGVCQDIYDKIEEIKIVEGKSS
jgi:very-short-patch-repair endonuclease